MNASKHFFDNRPSGDINRRLLARAVNLEEKVDRLEAHNQALKHLLEMVANTIGTPVVDGTIDTEAMALTLIDMVKIRNSVVKEGNHAKTQ